MGWSFNQHNRNPNSHSNSGNQGSGMTVSDNQSPPKQFVHDTRVIMNHLTLNNPTSLNSFPNQTSPNSISLSAYSPNNFTSSSESNVSQGLTLSSNAPQPKMANLSYNTNSTNGLIAFNSLIGHSGPIFAICHDEVKDQVISSSKDGFITVWKDNKSIQRISLPRHYACSMDINPRLRSLFVCGVAKDSIKETNPNPSILHFNIGDNVQNSSQQSQPLQLSGNLDKVNTKLVSCVKTLSDSSSNTFVTGETSELNSSGRETVAIYDLNSLSSSNSFDKLTPIVTYEEHENIITSLANMPRSDGFCFFSASKDCTIKLWDKRMQKSAGTFGFFQNGRFTSHDQMITCLDSFDNILASGGLDRKVILWDLRALSFNNGFTQALKILPVDDPKGGVLKVAIGPSINTAAVSTLRGLFFMDFNKEVCVPAISFNDRVVTRYHDLKWNHSRGILYAGGDDMRIDMYQYTT